MRRLPSLHPGLPAEGDHKKPEADKPELTGFGPPAEFSERISFFMKTSFFSEVSTKSRTYQTISVEGREIIGEGANGIIYRLDRENVVKVYKNEDAIPEIHHELEAAKLALILGIPTAISYDIVRVGDRYGAVFELLDAQSFAKILAEEPERMDWCVREYVGLLKTIHGTAVPEGRLPSMRKTALEWIARMKADLPCDGGKKLENLVRAVPEQNSMVHGDYHTKNIVLAGGEVLLIDMDMLSVGHPVFELAQMYNAYIGFAEYDPDIVKKFQGFDAGTAAEFWRRSLKAYLGTADEEKFKKTEEKVRCVAYTRLIDWGNRHMDPGSREAQEAHDLWVKELSELLERVDTIMFEP